MDDRRDTRRFLALAIGLGLVCQLAAIWLGLQGRGRPFVLGTMWVPAVAALVASARTRRMAVSALKRSGWRYWPVALGVGWSFIILRDLVGLASGQGGWNHANFPLAVGGGVAGVEGLATVLGFGPQSYPLLALNLVLTLIIASAFLAVVGGIGEELGWRAVLQPLLAKRFGLLKGTLLVGLVWAYWHVPLNLAGYNDSDHPMLVTFVFFPIFVVAAAFALAWLYRISGRAIWPAALAHAGNNVISAGTVIRAASWRAETGCAVAAAILIGGFFAWQLYRIERHEGRTHSEPVLV